ncbi:MAG TPA: flavodoxin domain-containing protein [Methanomassiliicoccales archaeon]|nr:flavodoxin domain-containing protein [Methanomassiliicoccales archaeon]
MKALIVYDTESGNTEKIALAISAGMKEVGTTVEIRKADSVTEEDFKGADAWIVGTPTHAWSATGKAKKALKLGIASGASGKKGTAFDTRFENVGKGGAEKLSKMMEDAGIQIVAPPEGFVVKGMKGPLAEGEEAKATTLGRRIAGVLRP